MNPLKDNPFYTRQGPSAYGRVLQELREQCDIAGTANQHAAELERCKADVVYWCNTYVKTYDPRTPGKALDFKLWPRQQEFFNWLNALRAEAQHLAPIQVQGLCDKSRDVGVSFLTGAAALHQFLFVPGYKCGFGSRKLEYVDSLGDLKTNFEKIRFMLRRLPPWMLPRGWKPGKHDCHCKFVNPANESAIIGEGGDEIGRGDRTSEYFVDESPYVEHPHLMDQALIATTGLRVDFGTPNGPGNPFAVKRFSLPAHRVFSFHWRDDPRKSEEWAEATRKEKGAVAFAAEYDLDYSASIEGICIPGAWVRAAVGLDLGPEAGDEIAGLDVGEEGNDLSVFIARRGWKVRPPISWARSLTTDTAWRARDEGAKRYISRLYYDPVGVGAGVKSTFEVASRDKALNGNGRTIPFSTSPVNAGASPTDVVWPDGESSKAKFANLKAELWWCLRRRFERTFEHVSEGKQHQPSEMISLPNDPQLIAQLSLPLYRRTETGKIAIESKDALRKRGIKSPDFAEALVLSEAAYVRPQFWFA
jgi:hypothetical protein